ncbi:MAG: flagellar biosynthesis protein FliO [Thermoleophilia bacterium]|nr:flagellar biosynthesis protein FliO [Thermoleophilia bacterium]
MKLVPSASLVAIALVALTLVFAPAASAVETAAKDAPATATTKAAKAKAAVPKAANDDFEDKKLDQGAFEAEDEAATKAEAEEGNGGSFVRMIFGLLVVVGAIYGVHWMLKKWSQARVAGAAGGTAGLIDVVATTPLAAGRSVHLIRVGGELVLVGATDQSITRLGNIEHSHLASVLGNEAVSKFDSLLSGALAAPTPVAQIGTGAPAAALSATTADTEPFLKRFVHNLRLSTAR